MGIVSRTHDLAQHRQATKAGIEDKNRRSHVHNIHRSRCHISFRLLLPVGCERRGEPVGNNGCFEKVLREQGPPANHFDVSQKPDS
jgi:hypothetical protein